MTINITTLEDFCKRNGFFICTYIDFDEKPKTFTFTELDKQVNPPTADLTVNDIDELLLLNHITGKGGKVEAAQAVSPTDHAGRPLADAVKQRKIEKLIYDTIAKYIGLMLGTMPLDRGEPVDVKLLRHHRKPARSIR